MGLRTGGLRQRVDGEGSASLTERGRGVLISRVVGVMRGNDLVLSLPAEPSPGSLTSSALRSHKLCLQLV